MFNILAIMEEDKEIVEEELVEVEDDDTETEEEVAEEPVEEVDWEARAKKAEALIVKHKKEPVAKKEATPATPANVEETVLLAQGMDEELLEQLKKVASLNGTSLIKAQKDPLFVAVKEKFEKDNRQSKAGMGAARGAGGAKVQKSVSSPGLTREEHMNLAKKAL